MGVMIGGRKCGAPDSGRHAQALHARQHGFSIQCSIGIALYPQDGATLDDLIKQSDTAMYRSRSVVAAAMAFTSRR